jgi:hypothetical protein
MLQREDTRETIRMAIKALEVIPLDMFAKNGWIIEAIIEFAYDYSFYFVNCDHFVRSAL